MIKSLYYNIKNNIALDYISSKISNTQKEETIKILYGENIENIESLKSEILEYKNTIFLENIPKETINKIFYKKLISEYSTNTFNQYTEIT